MSVARVAFVILACMILFAGCSGKPLANPATSVTFNGQTTYQPGAPVIGDLITLSFTLIDNTTDGTAITAMPYQVSLDGAVIATGSTAAIAANSTTVTTSVIQISTAGEHTVVITLDPGQTTGFVDASANAQTLLITVGPAASG
jgi:hypothetical protein